MSFKINKKLIYSYRYKSLTCGNKFIFCIEILHSLKILTRFNDK